MFQVVVTFVLSATGYGFAINDQMYPDLVSCERAIPMSEDNTLARFKGSSSVIDIRSECIERYFNIGIPIYLFGVPDGQ